MASSTIVCSFESEFQSLEDTTQVELAKSPMRTRRATARELEAGLSITVAPNPATGGATLRLTTPVVELPVSFEGFASGVYTVVVELDGRRAVVRVSHF
jgi:hypothetical protein